MNHRNLFNESKAAQAAAYFLFKAGGRLPVLKLMKLMYLAERKSYELFGYPIIGDSMVAMDHGPVLSITLNNVNGMNAPNRVWEEWIADRAGNDVALRDGSMIRSDQDLRQLSESDVEALSATWEAFGHFQTFVLRDYTHDALPEWHDPHGSSHPIKVSSLLGILGMNDDEVKAIDSILSTQANINKAFQEIAESVLNSRSTAPERTPPQMLAAAN